MIKIRIHAIADFIAFLTILTFWLSMLISKTLGSHADIAAVNLALMGLVLFGSIIDDDQLWFRQVGNDLDVSVIGTTDSVTVDEWYSGTSNRLDLDDGNGYTLAAENVEALRNAMASFNPPAFGETELSSGATDYSIVITAIPTSWQSP